MPRETTVDQVAFWRHDGVVYYVHSSADPGRAPVLVINAMGPGQARRFAVLSRAESPGASGWELDDRVRRSHFMETILASVRGDSTSAKRVCGDSYDGHSGLVA